MRLRVLVAAPVLLALAACTPTSAGDDLASHVRGLPGVAAAAGLPGQGDTTGIRVTLAQDATEAQAAAAMAAWVAGSPHDGTAIALVDSDGQGQLVATTPVDDRLDDIVADWWAADHVGVAHVTADYGDVDYVVYPTGTVGSSGPAAVADLAEAFTTAVPSPQADSVSLRAERVGVTSKNGDFDAELLRALGPAFVDAGADASLDLTVSSVPVVRFTADDAGAFRALLRAVPFSSGAVVQLSDRSGVVATLRAGTCAHDGDASLWSYWGGAKACG